MLYIILYKIISKSSNYYKLFEKNYDGELMIAHLVKTSTKQILVNL